MKTLEEACKREIKEETGYEVEIDHMIPVSYNGIVKFKNVELQLLVFAFVCHDISKGEAIDADKVLEHKWVKPDSINFDECLNGVEIFLKGGGYIS